MPGEFGDMDTARYGGSYAYLRFVYGVLNLWETPHID